jgi:hypothetical protein
MCASPHPVALNFKSPEISCSRDLEGNVRHIEHTQQPVGLGRRLEGAPAQGDLEELARKYIDSVKGADGYNIEPYPVYLDTAGSPEGTDERQSPAAGARARGVAEAHGPRIELRLAEVKALGNETILTMSQSFAGIEVWRAGLSLSIHHLPDSGELVVTSSHSTLHAHKNMEAEPTLRLPTEQDRFTPDRLGRDELATALRIEPSAIKNIESKRLLVYKYDPKGREARSINLRTAPLASYIPPGLLPLRRVPRKIKADSHYTVTEVLFTTQVEHEAPRDSAQGAQQPALATRYTVHWRAFLEIGTGAIVYLRAFVSGCLEAIFPPPGPAENVVALGRILCADPLTTTGNDPFRLHPNDVIETALTGLATPVSLPDIQKSQGEWQFLQGKYVQINTMLVAPFAPNPRVSTAGPHPPNFTEDILADPVAFTAVNAYYHCTMVFRLMERLGFDDVMNNYFHGATASPILVDPGGTDGALNAMVFGNSGSNGVEKIVFGPMQPGNSQVGMGVGNAADVRVVLHEFCHTLLFAQLNSANFGFAHSAGDSLAAILCDPDSHLRSDKTLRFQTFPWIASANPERKNGQIKPRYHGGDVDGRDDMEQWGWRGIQYFSDQTGYLREQILSMTLFHIYRSLGGDSEDIEMRRLAALYVVYLVIKAIARFPSAGNLHTDDATVLATNMMAADTGEGKLKSDFFSKIRGGGVHKVIRWGFEKHGLYHFSPVPARANEHSPGKGQGAPPMVDVYIDDKDMDGNPRRGEYTAADDYTTTEIWNRVTPGAGAGPESHEEPRAGGENHLFVRIRNRGYRTATGASVGAYFALQPAGGELLWNGAREAGGDWVAMAGSQQDTAGLNIKRGDEIVAGPFKWAPDAGGAGREVCVLASVRAPGDPSNLDDDAASLAPGYTAVPAPLWWLVPFDNNVGRRNMTLG